MLHQIAPQRVTVGMYVTAFGGPWFDHPFWLSRFVVREQDLDRIHQSGVPYVVIDDERGVAPDTREATVAHFAPHMPGVADKLRRFISERSPEPAPRRERQRALALVARSLTVMRRAFKDVRLGRAVRMAEVTAVVDEVVDFVERCPRTLLEVLRLKKKDEYTYLHSVAVCTLMVNMARHLGKDDRETREYGMAGLLHDLGKTGIADDILNKPGRLTDAEYDEVRNHPERGYEILLQSPDVSPVTLDVCRHHHERVDGKGYPFGLPASAISLAARLGAICDVYDALTSERSYKHAWAPIEAIGAMWSWEGQFDRELLFTFMQSIHVFPPGMLVHLRSNRLAVVLEPKRRNARLRVLAFYATREREAIVPEEVVIADTLANDSVVGLAPAEEWGLADLHLGGSFAELLGKARSLAA